MRSRPAVARAGPMTRNVKLLLAARVARSVGQGTLVVSFALYLQALGYSGTSIGLVLMAGLLFGACLTLLVGPLSDKRGSRELLLLYESAAALAALAALVSMQPALLIAAATVGSFGRGANGAAGPFSPVEQAWLAREVSGATRRHVFVLNATLGFLGMGVGAALAAVPSLAAHGPAELLAYRGLFAVPLLGSLVAILLLSATREAPVRQSAAAALARHGAGESARAEGELQRHENRLLRRLALTNLMNGLALGILGPLMAYWFSQRFGQGPGLIGPTLAAGFLLGAVGSQIGGWLSALVGSVRSVLWMRLVGLVLLVAVPFAPSFAAAAALFAARGAFNRGTLGARQSVAVELTRAERRGLAATVQSLSLQLPRAAGPVLGGWLIHSGQFVAPFLLVAALQLVYLTLFGRFFGGIDEVRRAGA